MMKSLYYLSSFSLACLILLFISSMRSHRTNSQVDRRPYPSLPPTVILPTDAEYKESASMAVLWALNHSLSFLRAFWNVRDVSLRTIHSVDTLEFAETQKIPKLVQLTTRYSNSPIQGYHYDVQKQVYMSTTILNMTLFVFRSGSKKVESHSNEKEEEETHKQNVVLHLTMTHEQRWCITSLFMSSLHLLPLLDQVLHQYQPDLVGVQELRTRVQYFTKPYPNDDPQLLHSFQLYDLFNGLSYFRQGEGEGMLANDDDQLVCDTDIAKVPSTMSMSTWQFYSWPAMFFKELAPEQAPEHVVSEGLALLSRFPIVKTHKLLLHRDISDALDFHQRLLLGITVDLSLAQPDTRHNHQTLLDVFTTHLSLSEAGRNRTLPQIGAYAKKRLQREQHHLLGSVIMGDFNCEMDLIRDDILSGYEFVDTWKASGKCEHGSDIQNAYYATLSHFLFETFNYEGHIHDWIHSMFINYDPVLLSVIEIIDNTTAHSQYNQTRHIYLVRDYGRFDPNTTHRTYLSFELNTINRYWKDNNMRDLLKDKTERKTCENGWTFNSWAMKKRIDYMFVNKEMFESNKVKHIDIVGDNVFKKKKGLKAVGGVEDMRDTLWSSDHRNPIHKNFEITAPFFAIFCSYCNEQRFSKFFHKFHKIKLSFYFKKHVLMKSCSSTRQIIEIVPKKMLKQGKYNVASFDVGFFFRFTIKKNAFTT
ncbi:hypothetical protein RFI_06252 [Reticulomyxa filosa]|uniref:Endonuclease/exonuclease/phosphatase domain-containing protein n=1 Tax=Reticulomyxa filosa TaxID=46433 RepID=X6NYH3_RETFI|nr:hypothetical protein RFI_06252 [Reticulomyxa filosa]|eukprot:ETO30869.1 hypothetical protein RFI_06252 [Reticulomyxa filosa]